MSRPASWTAVALGVAAGFLVGVLFVIAIGGDADPPRTRTVTVLSRAPPLSGDETVVTKTAVPDVVGERLDTARDRLERAGFDVDEDDGGMFGSIVDSNWEVVEQDPPPGTLLERGSSVRISLDRR
ncbi:PASTA domain-containing protein [Conexibacter woesei]|uniref:PASTA domain containing protein n=1 Tax=Conexibacter woesei (strain DSM 14684 / CCUG 47730 / CIP 108061 / JCM 11494 / NBRC 100937 / ID131577) TaxID=469383 RepID=D3FE01_CONWI|nr:PASTA domain-containing protein [Conexibacter woesei]ADB51617.1 PASTA domain containing protein [Conexibacter woesei DSM 14684]